MKIQRLFVSNFKNLVDCEITPSGIHAITGCNSTGKSNFLSVFLFVSELLTGSDETRQNLMTGFLPDGSPWIPFQFKKTELDLFRFEISCQIYISENPWQVDYRLEIPINPTPKKCEKISLESLTFKQLGKTGRARSLIERKEDGTTTINYERERKGDKFKTKSDMSALQSLEVREADDFPVNFPVASAFVMEIKNSRLVRLDPESFIKQLNPKISRTNEPERYGNIILNYDPYERIKEIIFDKARRKHFLFWLKEIGEIENITCASLGDDNQQWKSILIKQHGRFLYPGELSMGATTTIGILTALFSSLNTGGVVLLEEPETHLHPQAIVKLIELFREFSDKQNILMTTHSPVVLNSLNPGEVTVMRPLDNGSMTTQKVADIKEAIDTLNRGFFSLGDLLQTNFKNE